MTAKTKKETKLSKNYIIGLVNSGGCFDLQFRRDVRYERRNQPTYYRWKAQFVIVFGNKETELLEEIKNILNCGQIHFARKNQVRYSVQDIDNLYNIIVPFFKKHQLSGEKRKDFKLWSEAIAIIYKNKSKNLATWNRKDFQSLTEIQKLMQNYKAKGPRGFKWISIAESIAKTLQN